jgi:hypothetical protein
MPDVLAQLFVTADPSRSPVRLAGGGAMPLEEGEVDLIESAEFRPLRNWTRFTTRREAISDQGFVLDKSWTR